MNLNDGKEKLIPPSSEKSYNNICILLNVQNQHYRGFIMHILGRGCSKIVATTPSFRAKYVTRRQT